MDTLITGPRQPYTVAATIEQAWWTLTVLGDELVVLEWVVAPSGPAWRCEARLFADAFEGFVALDPFYCHDLAGYGHQPEAKRPGDIVSRYMPVARAIDVINVLAVEDALPDAAWVDGVDSDDE